MYGGVNHTVCMYIFTRSLMRLIPKGRDMSRERFAAYLACMYMSAYMYVCIWMDGWMCERILTY